MSVTSLSHDLEREGRALVERLGGRWTAGKGGSCRCPVHDDRRPSLSVRPGARALLLHCFGGCETVRIIHALRALGHPVPGAATTERPALAQSHQVGPSPAALRLWQQARPVAGSLAERYLSRRGLADAGPELRFHPRTPHGPQPFTQYRPALIAALRDRTGLVAIHRTFLDPRGARLAPLDERRLGLGAFGAGAVRLAEPGSLLGLAEGIETALAATALFAVPCWATLGADRFARVELPEGVERLVLFLDNDAAGRRAEALARAAFDHLAIEARYPRAAGADWNDVLLARRGSTGGR